VNCSSKRAFAGAAFTLDQNRGMVGFGGLASHLQHLDGGRIVSNHKAKVVAPLSLLTMYGVLILASGIYGLFVPATNPVAMSHLHIGIWWGSGMLVLGLAYVVRFRPKRKDM